MTSDAPSPELVDEKTGEILDVTPAQTDALTEFGRDHIGMDRALGIANQLDAIIREKGLSVPIGQSDHLRVEAWCACASMVGVTPRTEWSREARSPSGELEGYDARVEVVQIATGAVIGAAEAGCYFDEKMRGAPRWTERHAVKSMAQTRATSKAIGQVLRWIPVLAGYSGTPAEEMPANGDMGADTPARPTSDAARKQRESREDKGDGTWVWPAGKHKGTPIGEVPDDYLDWWVANRRDDDVMASAKRELARRAREDAEPEEGGVVAIADEDKQALFDASVDRARALLDAASLGKGLAPKYETEDALATAIRKAAMAELKLTRETVQPHHVKPLRHAMKAADITGAGEVFIVGNGGDL
jgi:hypothetical protein